MVMKIRFADFKNIINYDRLVKVNNKNILDVRNYENDIPLQTNLISRVTLASVPFLMLHSTLRLPVSLVMGSLRIVNSTGYQRWGAVASLAFTIMKSPIGTLLTAIDDILIEMQQLPSSKNQTEAAIHLIKICNNLLFLALSARGGRSLHFLSCAMNIIVVLLNSLDEFKKDRWIEGSALLLMASVRLHQLNTQFNYIQKICEIEKYIEKIFLNFIQKNIYSNPHQISPGDRSKYGDSLLLADLFIKRHSGTDFDARPLNGDQIVALVESARWTPSSYNDQPWNFIFCDRYKHPEAYAKIVESLYGQDWVEEAPLLVISVVRPEFSYNKKENGWAQYDTGAAAMSMSLQATELGLIAHQIGGFDPETIRQEFSLPKGYQPISVIAIGYEKKPLDFFEEQERVRLPTEKNFFFGEWGQQHLKN